MGADIGQRGEAEGIAKLLAAAREPRPGPRQQSEWDALIAQLGDARDAFDECLKQVDEARDTSIGQIKEHEATVERESKRLVDLGHKVETLAHDAASDTLSRQY